MNRCLGLQQCWGLRQGQMYTALDLDVVSAADMYIILVRILVSSDGTWRSAGVIASLS